MPAFFEHPISIQGNVFFASDFHFGVPDEERSQQRENAIVQWLDQIQNSAQHLFLLGDIFDFWFEYRDVIPKGFCHFFAKLREFRQKGIQIYYFTGNHDMWVKDYFSKYLGIKIFRSQQAFIINGKRCVIGHGDGLDPTDKGYLLIKKIFASRINIALYGALPPRWAFALARACSRKSRNSNSEKKLPEIGNQKIIEYISAFLHKEQADCFIYGHTHLPTEVEVATGTIYYNTGDWLTHQSYLSWTEEGIKLFCPSSH
ncbi:MAG: UDP-2,3-diacylglucosamine diphosphatase [Bacteroidales bacterium]|nr:UDP-2,3-diacylglucosamine diphosphatase [Bacteroidales bacterium]